MKSIMQNEKVCYISGRSDRLERHHVFGKYNKKNSEKYGLMVFLNHDYHNEPPFGVHHNRNAELALMQGAQRKFMEVYPELNFLEIFGRNYL